MFLVDDPILTRESAKDKIELTYGDLPPIIPERPKGKWEFHKSPAWTHDFMCSECKGVVTDTTNFCPNCGADMRGVSE